MSLKQVFLLDWITRCKIISKTHTRLLAGWPRLPPAFAESFITFLFLFSRRQSSFPRRKNQFGPLISQLFRLSLPLEGDYRQNWLVPTALIENSARPERPLITIQTTISTAANFLTGCASYTLHLRPSSERIFRYAQRKWPPAIASLIIALGCRNEMAIFNYDSWSQNRSFLHSCSQKSQNTEPASPFNDKNTSRKAIKCLSIADWRVNLNFHLTNDFSLKPHELCSPLFWSKLSLLSNFLRFSIE